MNEKAFGLIYTGESNNQLRDITYSRSIAAVPFGGRYRCIDFILSNLRHKCCNTIKGIRKKKLQQKVE